MPLKYEENLNLIAQRTNSSCIESYSPREIESYRFTFNDITDSRNFIPMALIDDNLKNRCGFWALSFNETLEQSEESWNYLISNRPNKFKKIGTAIARGLISEDDGICNDSNERGHFDCHEFEETDFRQKFQIIKILKDDE